MANAHPKVFGIGPNKAGTSSLNRLFAKSGYLSSHWREDGVNLARFIITNLGMGRDPIADWEQFDCFWDLHFIDGQITIEPLAFYRELYAYHPEAYFVLNTRPIDHWLVSRKNHQTVGLGRLIDRYQKLFACSESEVMEMWRQYFTTAHNSFRDFFGAKGSARFLEFDIENDPIEKLIEFVADDYTVDPDHWGVHNKTKVVNG